MPITSFRAYIYISLAVIFWGASFVATKIALAQFDVFTLLFVRFLLALLLFSPLFIIRKRFPSFTRKEHLKIFLLSFFQPVLYFYFETQGLKLTSAANVSLIIATIPVFVLVLSSRILKETVTVPRICGIMLSIAGTVVLVVGASGFSLQVNDSMKGDLFVFGAVAAASLFAVLLRELSQRHSVIDLTMMQIVYGTIFFFLLSLPHLGAFRPMELSAGPVIAVLYLAVFCTVLAFLFYSKSFRSIPASQGAVFINCIPVVTIITARFVLRENLTAMQYIGAGIVLMGVLLANVKFGPGARKNGEAAGSVGAIGG